MAETNPTKRVTRSAAKAAAAHSVPEHEPHAVAAESSPKPTTSPAKPSRKREAPEKKRSSRAKKVTKSSTEQSVMEGSKKTPDVPGANEADEVAKVSKTRVTAARTKAPRAKKGANSSKTPVEQDTDKGSAVEADAADEIIESTCNVEWGACEDEFIKIVTWNICSCRTALKNGALLDYLKREDPDILLVQETKMSEDAVKEFPELDTHDVYWSHSQKKRGYSGVAVICSKDLLKTKDLSVETVTPGMGNAEADAEGRVLTVVLSNDIAIVNAYVPNAGGKLARLPYRTGTFEPEMRTFLDKLRQKHRRVVYSGDLNVAHHPIDIHESKRNEKSAGHTPQERAEMTKLLTDDGWRDVWRELHPRTRGYTYFSRRFGDRLKLQNKGVYTFTWSILFLCYPPFLALSEF